MVGTTSPISSFKNVFGVLPQEMQSFGAALTTPATPTAKDLATFSPAANMMQELLPMDMQQSNGTAGTDGGELDLSGLAQLKQQGEMLANMLQMKLKSFGANLLTGMNNAGLDPSQEMNMQNGANGLSLLGDAPNKEGLEGFLKTNGKLQEQFKEIANFANVLDTLQQVKQPTQAAPSPAALAYAQQNKTEKRPDAQFVLHVMQGNVSYSFD
jgi:hypothetical protein